MYEGVIYFAGPKSRWAGAIDPGEVIARLGPTAWRWHARFLTLSAFAHLDPSRCGYALLRDGVCVEQYDPEVSDDLVCPERQ